MNSETTERIRSTAWRNIKHQEDVPYWRQILANMEDVLTSKARIRAEKAGLTGKEQEAFMAKFHTFMTAGYTWEQACMRAIIETI